MARKTDVFNVSSIDTVIGSGVALKGNIASEGDIAIDGTLTGNIKSGGHVAIGMNATVTGSIQATSVQIAGHVSGNIIALDAVSLIETARIQGDITTTHLEVMLGAIFIGESKMKPAEASEVKAPATAE